MKTSTPEAASFWNKNTQSDDATSVVSLYDVKTTCKCVSRQQRYNMRERVSGQQYANRAIQ